MIKSCGMGNGQHRQRTPRLGGPADGAVNPAQSVDRALTILEVLARHGELGVTDIADGLGVHKSTAFRLVNALEQHRLVEQIGERGKYRLGFGLVRLAGATTARMSLAEESRPFCRRLATEFNETVNIAVLDADAAVNITQDQGSAAVTVQNWIGKPTPLHATSSGEVLLAWAPANSSVRSWSGVWTDSPSTPSPAPPRCVPSSGGSAKMAGDAPLKNWRSVSTRSPPPSVAGRAP